MITRGLLYSSVDDTIYQFYSPVPAGTLLYFKLNPAEASVSMTEFVRLTEDEFNGIPLICGGPFYLRGEGRDEAPIEWPLTIQALPYPIEILRLVDSYLGCGLIEIHEEYQTDLFEALEILLMIRNRWDFPVDYWLLHLQEEWARQNIDRLSPEQIEEVSQRLIINVPDIGSEVLKSENLFRSPRGKFHIKHKGDSYLTGKSGDMNLILAGKCMFTRSVGSSCNHLEYYRIGEKSSLIEEIYMTLGIGYIYDDRFVSVIGRKVDRSVRVCRRRYPTILHLLLSFDLECYRCAEDAPRYRMHWGVIMLPTAEYSARHRVIFVNPDLLDGPGGKGMTEEVYRLWLKGFSLWIPGRQMSTLDWGQVFSVDAQSDGRDYLLALMYTDESRLLKPKFDRQETVIRPMNEAGRKMMIRSWDEPAPRIEFFRLSRDDLKMHTTKEGIERWLADRGIAQEACADVLRRLGPIVYT